MDNPKYNLTPYLLKNITEIERLYGNLESLKVPRELYINLERDNLVKSSYSSNKIEGNPLSMAEVTNLLLGNRVPANRDEKEVTNYFNILKTLDTYIERDINIEIVLNIHKDLLSGVNSKIAGNIRNSEVVIGKFGESNEVVIKHNPPFHKKSEIEKALIDLLDWIGKTEDSPLLKIGSFHHQFVYIHPFEDGNGRVCRLTTALLFLKNRYQINRYFILDDYYDLDRDLYSDKLHSADKGDKTEWLEYFTDGVKYSLQSALSKLQNGLENLSISIRPTPKEKEVLELFKIRNEMKSSDLITELNVSRQQVHNLLNALVEKGFLIKKGSTKDSYYVLK